MDWQEGEIYRSATLQGGFDHVASV